MTDKQYNLCVSEAQNYTDKDAYISDIALSSVWGDGVSDDVPPERIEQISSIYDAVHRSVKDIAAAAGMSVRAMAIRFCIPQRTMEGWYISGGSARQCPLYIRLMLQECLGLIRDSI